MVQVKIEIRTGTARFRVSVKAQSAQRAMSFASARYPGGEVTVLRTAEPIFAGVGTEPTVALRKAA